MAAYLRFHELDASPFEPPTNNRFVLATEALRRAYAEIRSGLDEGSPRVCLSGGAGIGKSSLAAALPKLLESGFRSVLIRDPSVPWDRLKSTLVRQLALPDGQLSRSTLQQAAADGRGLVLIFDQAEEIEAESLEHLDVILGYKNEDGKQLVQCVLLANLESAPRGQEIALLWWLDQLTTLQLSFSPIPAEGIGAYVNKHLKKAGWKGGDLFTDDAIVAIHQYTGGIPGTVSALCEQLLARAAELRVPIIDGPLVRAQFEPESSEAESEATAWPEDETPIELGTLGKAMEEPEEGPTPAWPQLGSFAEVETPPPPPVQPTRPSAEHSSIFDEPEPEMKIEQGFVPMEEPRESASLADDFHVSSSRSSWGAAPPLARRSFEPTRPGMGKTLMLLTATSLAFAAYAYWPADAPIAKPKLSAMIPPPQELVKSVPGKLDSLFDTQVESPLSSLLDATPDSPLDEDDTELKGLTADLRVRDTNASAAKKPLAGTPSAAAAVARRTASETTEPEPPVFEPWAEQQPEPLSEPGQNTASSPASPAATDTTSSASEKKP